MVPFSGCFYFQTPGEAWEKSSWRRACVYRPKGRKGKSKRFHAGRQQSVNKASTSPCLRSTLCVQAGVGGMLAGPQADLQSNALRSSDWAQVSQVGTEGQCSGHETVWKDTAGVCAGFHVAQAWRNSEQQQGSPGKCKLINKAGSWLLPEVLGWVGGCVGGRPLQTAETSKLCCYVSPHDRSAPFEDDNHVLNIKGSFSTRVFCLAGETSIYFLWWRV